MSLSPGLLNVTTPIETSLSPPLPGSTVPTFLSDIRCPPEQEGYDYRRKSASFRRRQLKSRGCDDAVWRALSRVNRGTLRFVF
jgi:hypothetical protein